MRFILLVMVFLISPIVVDKASLAESPKLEKLLECEELIKRGENSLNKADVNKVYDVLPYFNLRVLVSWCVKKDIPRLFMLETSADEIQPFNFNNSCSQEIIMPERFAREILPFNIDVRRRDFSFYKSFNRKPREGDLFWFDFDEKGNKIGNDYADNEVYELRSRHIESNELPTINIYLNDGGNDYGIYCYEGRWLFAVLH